MHLLCIMNILVKILVGAAIVLPAPLLTPALNYIGFAMSNKIYEVSHFSQLHSLQVRARTLAGSGNWSMSVRVRFGKFFYRMLFTVCCVR